MEVTSSTNVELIKKLLVKDKDLKLSNHLKFITTDHKELTAGELIELIKNEEFSRIFCLSDEIGTKTELVDLDSKVFVNLLKYIYSNKIVLDLVDLSSTYLAAKKYSISDLCKNLMDYADKKSLTIDNSTIIYDQYLKIGDVTAEKLNEIVDIIDLHTFVAIQSKEFVNISKETLIQILKSDKLFVKEKDLYYACIKWIKAELKRQNLDHENLENQLSLFSSIKNLIRFPIMKKEQFFITKLRFKRDWEEKDELAPNQSGLFSKAEIIEFEKYFETKDAKVLTVNYNKNPRAQMNIGRLDFSKTANNKFEFVMSTNIDDLHCYDSECTNHHESKLENAGDNHDYVFGPNYKKIKTKKITAKARKENLVCSSNSIRVFKVDVSGSSSDWDFGDHLEILEDEDVLLTALYKRYTVDNYFGYYSYFPTFELKKGHKYNFRFTVPDEGNVQPNHFRLDNIYTKNENNENVLDVKLTNTGGFSWAHPHRIFFLYN